MRRLTQSDASFRALAHQISDFAADYLASLPELPSYPPGISGKEVDRLFSSEIPSKGLGSAAFDVLPQVFQYARPSSPRFFGYVFGSGEPVASLGAFAASVLNQNATAWRSGPAAITIERTVVRWLAEIVGCQGFSASLTSGGSMSNLMGLCMAREAKAPANESGFEGGAIYCSTEAHMSIAKAAALLGFGRGAVRTIPVDDAFCMRTDLLRSHIEEDVRNKKRPIAVVATAGTTATGSIDPLNAIANVCAEFGPWLHIDGAYGAFASLVIPDAFRGIERADSLSLDPHKWLYQPAGCGCILYRDANDARRAFSHSADYARVLSNDPVEGFAFFEESMELSRPFRALNLWLSLRYHGLQAFEESITEDLRLAQLLAKCIDVEPRLERLAPVALSAVCFRFTDGAGESPVNLDGLNRKILDRVIQRGRVYISNALINGKFALRACIVNHRSTEQDVRAVVSEVLTAAQELA